MSLSPGTQWGKITLWDAAADGNLEQCKQRLSSSWTKINAQDAQGKTALHEACRWGHIEVAKFLISQKADPKITTVEGTTVLHLAALNGHDTLVNYLVNEVKMDVNVQDKFGDTPLIAASGSGKLSTTKLILSLGADITIRNRNKRTAQESASTSDVSALFYDKDYVSATKY